MAYGCVRVSDDFLTAEELKEGNACLIEFKLPFSETVKGLITEKCFEGREASYGFGVAARDETLGQIDRLKGYIRGYGIDIDGIISLTAPEAGLSGADLEKHVDHKKYLEKLAMTLAQLEENAVAMYPSASSEGIKDLFKAMVRSNYEAKLGTEGYVGSSLDKLKQLLHDVQVWEFNGRILSQGGEFYPALSYHVSSSRDTQAERDHTIAQVSRITQSVARWYGWVQHGRSSGFDQLPDKFIAFGVSEDLCDGRKGMKKTIEEIAFSLHILEERRVAGFKGMYPDASEADISEFREKTCREIGKNHSGDRFRCSGGTYPKLQRILNDIRSSESFESLLIFAKRQFAENLVSEKLNAVGRSSESTHIVPYVINTIARGWGLKEKDRREDENAYFYDNLCRDFSDFIVNFQTELTKRYSSESFIKVITENLSSKIMEKTAVDLPNFSKYEDSDGWITIIGEDGKGTKASGNVRRSQDDYIADIISVFSRFGINGYFGETDEAQEENVRTLLFPTTFSEDCMRMKVEVSYANLLRFVQFACMYKMASYDPPLISGVSKEVFKVPLESYKDSIKARGGGLPRRYIDPSVALSGFGFERDLASLEYAQYELVCFALDNDIKIYDANSHSAPITPLDGLLELDAASSGVLRRYLDNQFGNGGFPPLSLLMRITELEDARGLLRLCGVFRDERSGKLGEVLEIVSALQDIQAPGYVPQWSDFLFLRSLLSYYRLAEIKAYLSPSMGERFTEYLVREAIVLVGRNGLALRDLAPDLKNNKEVVLAAVGEDGDAFQYASDDLKRDREFVLAVITRNSLAFKHADASLREDKDFMLPLVRQDGYALKYADASLKRDREVVLAAVGEDGDAFQYASDDLKRDRDFVLAVITLNFLAFKHADASLRGDKDFMLPLVRQDGYALEYADASLKRDREVVLAAVGEDGDAFQYASDDLKRDREVVLAAVEQDGNAFKYAVDELRGDRRIVLTAVRQCGTALEYASDELRGDRRIVLTAVRQCGTALEYASDELRGDKRIVFAAVRLSGTALEYASDELRGNKRIVFAAVEQDGYAFKYAVDELRGDR